jgi:HEAT repeat protein
MIQGRIVLSLLLLCAPLCAQTPQELDELWRVGCQWQVGENIPKVAAARAALIEAGPPGLEYALGKLGASSTLETRCLTAVVVGFKEQAVDPLIERVAHEDPIARRNVAELLEKLEARRASDALLAQARVENSQAARLAQLGALADWHVAAAAPLVIEVSRDESQRARQKAAGLLSRFASADVTTRLIALVQDETYYVRTAAVEALKKSPVSAREVCFTVLQRELNADIPSAGLVRRLLPVVATLANDHTPDLLLDALEEDDAGVRADAAHALAGWKRGAGSLTNVDVDAQLKGALRKEVDPFVRAEIESARRTLTKTE